MRGDAPGLPLTAPERNQGGLCGLRRPGTGRKAPSAAPDDAPARLTHRGHRVCPGRTPPRQTPRAGGSGDLPTGNGRRGPWPREGDGPRKRRRKSAASVGGRRRRGMAEPAAPPPPPPPPASGEPLLKEEEEEEEEEGGDPPPRPGPGPGVLHSLGANQCFHCLITFPDEKFKERHMKREHPEDFVQANLRDALFVCFICNKAFGSSRALICHQRSHAPAQPSDCMDCLHPTFDCTDCGRRFGQLVNYQRHRLGHTAGHSLPHQCPECGKSFRQLSNLRRHQAFHQQTQELLPSRPYSCMECGENFSQEAGLHEHYILHARGEL